MQCCVSVRTRRSNSIMVTWRTPESSIIHHELWKARRAAGLRPDAAGCFEGLKALCASSRFIRTSLVYQSAGRLASGKNEKSVGNLKNTIHNFFHRAQIDPTSRRTPQQLLCFALNWQQKKAPNFGAFSMNQYDFSELRELCWVMLQALAPMALRPQLVPAGPEHPTSRCRRRLPPL